MLCTWCVQHVPCYSLDNLRFDIGSILLTSRKCIIFLSVWRPNWLGTICPGGPNFSGHSSMGTGFVGDHLSSGISFMGIVCPGGQEVQGSNGFVTKCMAVFHNGSKLQVFFKKIFSEWKLYMANFVCKNCFFLFQFKMWKNVTETVLKGPLPQIQPYPTS